jgi:hypothetical protein
MLNRRERMAGSFIIRPYQAMVNGGTQQVINRRSSILDRRHFAASAGYEKRMTRVGVG